MKSLSEYSEYLQELITKVGITNLTELSNLSGISEWQLWRLEAGLLPKIEVENLLKLAQILEVSLLEIIEKFYPQSSEKEAIFKEDLNSMTSDHQNLAIEQEYLRIKQELANQKDILEQEFQQQTLAILESYLIQFPTVIATIENNPELSAQKVIPFIKFIEKLLEKWNIQAIGKVGEITNYNPQFHQLMEGNTEINEQVKIRYVGYLQGEKILYRAKVSPVTT